MSARGKLLVMAAPTTSSLLSSRPQTTRREIVTAKVGNFDRTFPRQRRKHARFRIKTAA
jgi:hypothetical protein